MQTVVAFPNQAAAERSDAIEEQMNGARRCAELLELMFDGGRNAPLRAYVVDQLHTHLGKLELLLFPGG
jgi:hypothetical protein